MLIACVMYCQNIDTASASLTLKAKHWAWAIGTYGEGQDSATRSKIRAIRVAIVAANPATWETNVTINNLSGKVIVGIYQIFCNASFNIVLQMGANTAERTEIYTNIRAITNSAIQNWITQYDATFANEYIRVRNIGKNIVMDN